MTHRVEIEYCTQCRWLLRASWLAQELLTTFPRDLGEVALVPGVGGVFEVRLDGETLWSRAERGFPDLAQLKRLVREFVLEHERGSPPGGKAPLSEPESDQ